MSDDNVVALHSHIERGRKARQAITERFLAADTTPPPPNTDPVAVPAFLTMKAFKYMVDGTLMVTFLVPPHMAADAYAALTPFARELPLAVSVEKIPDELLAQMVNPDV